MSVVVVVVVVVGTVFFFTQIYVFHLVEEWSLRMLSRKYYTLYSEISL